MPSTPRYPTSSLFFVGPTIQELVMNARPTTRKVHSHAMASEWQQEVVFGAAIEAAFVNWGGERGEIKIVEWRSTSKKSLIPGIPGFPVLPAHWTVEGPGSCPRDHEISPFPCPKSGFSKPDLVILTAGHYAIERVLAFYWESFSTLRIVIYFPSEHWQQLVDLCHFCCSP